MPTLLNKTGLRTFSTKTSNAAKNTILDCALSLSLVVSIDFVNMYFIEFLTASLLTPIFHLLFLIFKTHSSKYVTKYDQ